MEGVEEKKGKMIWDREIDYEKVEEVEEKNEE